MQTRIDVNGGKDNAIVVGAGHVGIACAHYLERDGFNVTVIDQGAIGGGCSRANCGLLSPSHVLPLTTPDALWSGITSLLTPGAAFRFKPQLRWSLYRWMFQFVRRCTHRRMLAAGHVLKPLLDASSREYTALFGDPAIDCDARDSGTLYVFRTQKALDDYASTDRLLREHFGLGARRIEGAELPVFDAALRTGLAGGYYYDIDRHLRPDRLNASWSRHLRERGVTFMERTRLYAIDKSGAQIAGLVTSQGRLTADRYVFATGAWSGQLAKDLGVDIPIEPGKGYSVTMSQPAVMPAHPMLFPEAHVAVTPFSDGYRIGSMMEFVGFDASIPGHRIRKLEAAAAPYLEYPTGPAIEDTWSGWRPMTWDSLPVIGRVPGLSNALLATGHNMLGMTLAPVTGKLVADLVAERPTDLPIDALSPARFA